MCDITTLTIASIGMSVAGGAMQIQGQRAAHQSELAYAESIRQQSEYEAEVARRNQEIANNAALDALRRADVEVGRSQIEFAGLIGTQRAAFASAGVEVDSGSALDVIMHTARANAEESAIIRQNAEREAYDLRTRGEHFAAEAELAESRGFVPVNSPNILGTVFSTAGDIASTGIQYRVWQKNKLI